jgi:hypothetical protein
MWYRPFDVSIDGVTQMRQLSSDLMLATSVQNYFHNIIALDHVISTSSGNSSNIQLYLILLLCNTLNACLSIDSTVLDRLLEIPKNPIATLAWLSWLLRHRLWWCWRCLLWNANDTTLTFKMIIVDDKILSSHVQRLSLTLTVNIDQ